MMGMPSDPTDVLSTQALAARHGIAHVLELGDATVKALAAENLGHPAMREVVVGSRCELARARAFAKR